MNFVSHNQYDKSQDSLPELREAVFKETIVQNTIISSHLIFLHY
jgi:hypothetical protein